MRVCTRVCMYVCACVHVRVCMCVCVCLVTKSCPILLQPQGLQPARLLCPWDFPGRNTGVGCHALLQGIFLTQGSNLHLLMTLALAGGFFTASATWEARNMSTTPLKSIFRGKGALTFFVFFNVRKKKSTYIVHLQSYSTLLRIDSIIILKHF